VQLEVSESAASAARSREFAPVFMLRLLVGQCDSSGNVIVEMPEGSGYRLSNCNGIWRRADQREEGVRCDARVTI
jgi:hypothetical protein